VGTGELVDVELASGERHGKGFGGKRSRTLRGVSRGQESGKGEQGSPHVLLPAKLDQVLICLEGE